MAIDYGSFSWPSSAAGSNASVGVNGSPAPTSSTEIGGVNPEGNLTPVAVNDDGSLIFDTGLDKDYGVVGAQTLRTAAEIGNATGAAAFAAGATNPQTLRTESNQGAAGSTPWPVVATTGSAIIGKVGIDQTTPGTTNGVQVNAALPAGTNVIGHVITDTGSTTAVSNFPATQPVSGAVTANQGTANATPWNDNVAEWGGAATSLGQKTMGASVPVTIASDQSTIPVTDGSLDTYVTGAGPATAVINTNLLLPATGTTATDLQGTRSIAFQVVTGASTTAVAVNFESSNDNVNFVAVGMYDKTTPTAAPVATFTTAASTTRYFEGPTEFRYFRVRLVAAITAGTVQAFSIMRKTQYYATNQSLAAGTQSIGNIATVTTVSTVTAVTAITNALPAGTNVIGFTKQGGRAQAFPPVFTNYTTPVTTAAYTQLVASTTTALTYLDIFDSSGQAMIIATGASGSEVILAYVPPGGDQIAVTIPISTRIAIKALTANAVSGYNLLNGYN